MSRGVNKATVLGRIGSIDVRKTKTGDSIVNMSIATNEKWKDKNTGEMQELTTWHSVVAFGGVAGVAEKYCAKGDQVYIEGKMRLNKWTDDNGVDRYKTEILVQDLQLLSQPQSSGGSSKPPVDSYKKESIPPSHEPEFSDDIPF